MHKMIILTLALSLICLIGFLNHDAYAITGFDIKDQESCLSLPSGSPSWNSTTNTCTVTNVNLTIANGSFLTIENGVTFVINHGIINFFIRDLDYGQATDGTITNLGTIDNYGTFSGGEAGVFTNSGTINNFSMIDLEDSNNGLTNTGIGTINNSGTILANNGRCFG